MNRDDHTGLSHDPLAGSRRALAAAAAPSVTIWPAALHSEQEYRAIVQASMDGFWKLGFDGRILDCNDAACHMLGYSRDEMLTLSVGDIEHLEDPAQIAEHVRLVRTRGRDRFETWHRRKDGSTIVVEVSAQVLEDAAGGVLFAFLRDITAQRETQAGLHASEERYRTLFTTLGQGVIYLDHCGTIVSANPAAARLLGLPVERLEGLTCFDPRWRTIDRDGSPFPAQDHPLIRALRTGQPVTGVEMGIYCPELDRYRWLLVDAIPQFRPGVSAPYQSYTTFTDVTERKQAELVLRQAQDFTRSILDAISARVAVLDRHGTIIELNQAWCDLARKSGPAQCETCRATDIGANYLQIWRSARAGNSGDAEAAAEGIQAVLDGRLPFYSLDYPCRSPHPRRWFTMTVTPLGREGGGAVVCHSDISVSRLMAEELRQNEARTRSILRAAPVGICVLIDRVIQEVNDALTVMTGYRPEELVGRSIRMLYSTEEDYRHIGLDKYGQFEKKEISCVEACWRTRDGRVIDVVLSSAPIVPGDLGAGVTVTAQDITGAKRAEQDRLVREARQRDALVREVHHRIKNNLQGVIGLLRQHLAARPETQASIESAIGQVRTIAVVHGLQSRLSHNELPLSEMLFAVSTAATLAMSAQSPFLHDHRCGEIWLETGAAVSIALILNELIQNAVKHGRKDESIRIELSGNAQQCKVSIHNASGARLPPGLSLASGAGCGTGLGLVATLTPRKGASLDIGEVGGWVTAELVLSPPVISACPPEHRP